MNPAKMARLITIIKEFNQSEIEIGDDLEKIVKINIEDLKVDSLSKFQMVMNIEDELNCTLPEKALTKCATVGDLLRLCDLHACNVN
jgi:acyl carrier protein